MRCSGLDFCAKSKIYAESKRQDLTPDFSIVGELNVTDREWVQDYIANVTPMVERYGSRYLARTNTIERLEGKRQNPHVILIIEWPSKESALAFYKSEEYQPFLKNRLAGSDGNLTLVAGEDMNKVAGIA